MAIVQPRPDSKSPHALNVAIMAVILALRYQTIPHIPNRLGTQLAFRASDHKASSMYCDVQDLATEEPLVVRPRPMPDGEGFRKCPLPPFVLMLIMPDDISISRCLDRSASTHRGVAGLSLYANLVSTSTDHLASVLMYIGTLLCNVYSVL